MSDEHTSESMLRDVWRDVAQIGREVAKIDSISKAVDEIKLDVKEQRGQITDLREGYTDHSHRLHAIEGMFTPSEIDAIKRLVGRHRSVTAVVAAGATGAVTLTLMNLPALLHWLAHLSH